VFGAKVFVSVVRRYGLEREYITPYSSEQNGMIERFFLTLRQECVWLQRFDITPSASSRTGYHAERPHSALGYLTPNEYRGRLAA
jgi:putative transposase